MPLGAAAPILAHDGHTHMVLVQHRPHLIGGDEDVRLTVVTDDETVPIAMPLHRAFNLFERIA